MTGPNTSAHISDFGNRGRALLVVPAIATGVALIMTVVRIFVRGKIVKQLGLDDMCIVVANVSGCDPGFLSI